MAGPSRERGLLFNAYLPTCLPVASQALPAGPLPSFFSLILFVLKYWYFFSEHCIGTKY
jgi:hypothetical protein